MYSNIHVIRNRIFSSNTYLLQSNNNNCIIIDPGLDSKSIEFAINKFSLIPIGIISTHGHFDHIASVSYFKKKFSIPFFLHEKEIKIVQSANFYMKIMKIDYQIEIPFPDIILKGFTEKVSVGEFEFDIINFPGHSNGSCIIKHKKCLFSGDIIYKNGIFLNNFPGEDKVKLKESIKALFDLFADDNGVMVFPGHGDSALLESIKKNNSALLDFINSEE